MTEPLQKILAFYRADGGEIEMFELFSVDAAEAIANDGARWSLEPPRQPMQL